MHLYTINHFLNKIFPTAMFYTLNNMKKQEKFSFMATRYDKPVWWKRSLYDVVKFKKFVLRLNIQNMIFLEKSLLWIQMTIFYYMHVKDLHFNLVILFHLKWNSNYNNCDLSIHDRRLWDKYPITYCNSWNFKNNIEYWSK